MRALRVPLTVFWLGSLALTAGGATPKARETTDAALPPWNDGALPVWAQSVLVRDTDQALLSAPAPDAARRGSAMRGVRLPLFGAREAPGCRRPWLLVGPQAWLCQDEVTLSEVPPLSAGVIPSAESDGLPHRYYFASVDGSFAYERLEDVDVGSPIMQLEPGFAVAIVDERILAGERYGRTKQRMWVPMRDFGPARPIDFQGAELAGNVDVAWVVVNEAPLYRRQGGGFMLTGERVSRFHRVGWLERVDGWTGSFARIDERRWIRTRDVRHPTIAPPPEEPDIALGARWIDIELESQTLVAYEGARPVFATIVSTGKGKTKGHPFETPKGVHRIWVKLVTTTMDNLENEEASRYYRIEDVPWVQYFDKAVGLHAAFWHRSFGQVRSHGCVNLAPLDALRLFSFTSPRLPSGWTASLPTGYDRGTVVRVR
jgi:hypothetical protein